MVDKMPQGGYVYDLNIGESVEFKGSEGISRSITLLELYEPCDRVRGVIRSPFIIVDIDCERAQIPAALYNVPSVINGVKIGCSVTRGVCDVLRENGDVFALDKDARIRCWDPHSVLFGPRLFVYPVRQVWFASMTQLGNERCYVDAGELSLNEPDRDIYHHYGIDIGGYDKAVPVVSAVGGTVVRRGGEWAPDETPDENPRDDVVRIKDDIGWRYRYSHLDTIAPNIKIGSTIAAGDPVGILGKKGYSGGWSHLHFGIRAPQPSGRYGQVDAYPFFVEAYLNEHPGALLACARPHRVAHVGGKVELDGTRSLCDGGRITSYHWNFYDGKTADGECVKKEYEHEGMYSEMLTVTDDRGKSDVDFCVVQILPTNADPSGTPPSIHIAYYPTNNLRVAQPIAFKVRSFIRGPFAVNKGGEELWDFGDGATAATCSDNNYDECWHEYDRPGRYIVTVRRTGKNDRTAEAQLKLIVEE